MNQSQLNLLHSPKVQLLLDAGFEPYYPESENQKLLAISRRITQWFEEFSQPPIVINPFKTQEEISDYIQSNRQKFGNGWSPF